MRVRVRVRDAERQAWRDVPNPDTSMYLSSALLCRGVFFRVTLVVVATQVFSG